MEQRLDQLLTVLGEIKRLYDELGVVVQAKLEAMRRADADGIRSACSREEFLTRRLGEQDGLRKQILDLLGESLALGERRGRTLTLREVGERVGEPWRSRLLSVAAALKAKLEETAERNRVAALVSQEMVKHFRQVYEVMAQSNQTVTLYSRTGKPEARASRAVFDAVV